MDTKVGRLSPEDAASPILGDQSSRQVLALTTKVDQLTDALKTLCAKMDADAGVTDSDYAATVSDILSKLTIFI